MSAPLIALTASLDLVLEENTYSLARLLAHLLAKPFAPPFAAFQDEWMKVNTTEILLGVARGAAAAQIVACDDDLNDLLDAIDRTLLIQVKNDRSDPEYKHYFVKPANLLKRPVLGGQLETMRGWVPSLEASANPVLAALGASLAVAVAAADAAVKALATADQQVRDFRTLGARKALIDSFNALRKSTDGKLAELPHAHPEAKLPATFASHFFRREAPKAAAPAAPTSSDLTLKVADLEAQLAAAKAELAKALEQEAAAAKIAADLQADKVALAQAEQDEKAAAAKVAALAAKVGKK